MAAALIAVALALPVQAEPAGELRIATAPIERGISRGEAEPTVQGTLAWAPWAGPQISLTAGRAALDPPADLRGSRMELALAAGWRWILNERCEIALGAAAYRYPGASNALDYDYREIRTALECDAWRVELAHSADYFGAAQETEYLALGRGWRLGAYALNARLGIQHSERGGRFAAGDAHGHTWDYGVGIARGWGLMRAEIGFTGTQLSQRDCYGGQNWCAPRFHFAVSLGF